MIKILPIPGLIIFCAVQFFSLFIGFLSFGSHFVNVHKFNLTVTGTALALGEEKKLEYSIKSCNSNMTLKQNILDQSANAFLFPVNGDL